ncbi:MAG: nucleotide exchange factor GrpE [Kiritimatiellae bacterium]|nr:nucleotide exchange factor GrpE [Kiritimatiellia bacterium]
MTAKKEKEAGKKTVKVRKPASGSKKALIGEIDTLNVQLMRLQADFENFRKRTFRERSDLYKRANEDLMQEFLPVMDHMDMALESAVQHDADPALVDGFRLVSEQMLTVLEKFGLTTIKTDGVQFDPNIHEAISHVVSADVPEGIIAVGTRKGYMLGGKLLRASQAVVSRGKGEEGKEGEG